MAEEFDLFICRQRQPMMLIPLLMAVFHRNGSFITFAV